jgi:hypothetical protein
VQTLTSAPGLQGRRLVGSALYALLIMAVSLPIMIWIAGLAIGPQALRERILFTSTEFAAYHGRAGMFLVVLITFTLFTLYNFFVGARRRYGFNWGFVPRLFDDQISAREKVAAVLESGWGKALIAIDLGWIALAAFTPN